MTNRYILYIKESCPFCHKAIQHLNETEQNYNLITISSDSDLWDEVKGAYNWNTVPMIFKELDRGLYKFIGGYTDLRDAEDGR